MAKLIAANYNSTTSTAYGFMPTLNISLKNNTTYTLLCRYKYTKNNSSHPQILLYENSWSAGTFGISSAHSDMAVSTKVFTAPANAENYKWNINCYSWSYENQQGTGGKDGVLAVDWYELWEGDATQFSLTDAIGLSGTGVNLFTGLGGDDYSIVNSVSVPGGSRSIDYSTFGFPCMKFIASTDTGYCYKNLSSGTSNDYFNLSFDVYSSHELSDLGLYADGQKQTLISSTSYVPANTWTRVYSVYKTASAQAIFIFIPKKAGTYYIKDVKITRCNLETPINYSESTATTNTLPNNFNSIVSNVRNSNYFNNTNTSGINSLRNWMGYYYNTNTFVASTSLSTTSVAASGGTITVNYTVKENWTNGKAPTPKAGITPTITSSIGTVSNITATDANGNGTAKITVASRGITVGAALTGTVSVSFEGVTRTATFTQALNKITSVRIAGSIPTTGAYTNPPSYNNQAPASGTTWSPFTIYPTFSSGATQGNYGGSAIAQSNWNVSGEGFSVASVNGWWAVKVTAASRGTTIGPARTGTLTITIPDGVGGTVSGSTSLSQAGAIEKQERAVYYRNPATSLPILGIQGGFAFQTGFNTSFSSSTYTLPTNNISEDQYTGITLTEADSTKASSFYIYMNNVMVGVNSSVQPSVRMHLKVGVKSSATTFTETWYDQYITPTSIVYQDGVYVATWDTSKYALINIPASTGSGTLCHIDVEFTY